MADPVSNVPAERVENNDKANNHYESFDTRRAPYQVPFVSSAIQTADVDRNISPV